jgi:hypothetical protein
MGAARFFAGAALLAVALAAACSDDGRPCFPGDKIACSCGPNTRGYASCDQAGNAYGACDCSGITVSDAGTGGASDSGKKALMEPCATNEECESGMCHNFNAKGPKCSKPCEIDTDCPPPSTGCNNQKVCKAP